MVSYQARATTVSYSSRSRRDQSAIALAGIVILVASAFVYLRILIELAVVARGLLPELYGPVCRIPRTVRRRYRSSAKAYAGDR